MFLDRVVVSGPSPSTADVGISYAWADVRVNTQGRKGMRVGLYELIVVAGRQEPWEALKRFARFVVIGAATTDESAIFPPRLPRGMRCAACSRPLLNHWCRHAPAALWLAGKAEPLLFFKLGRHPSSARMVSVFDSSFKAWGFFHLRASSLAAAGSLFALWASLWAHEAQAKERKALAHVVAPREPHIEVQGVMFVCA